MFSRKMLYIGIIAYCAASAFLNDWPAQTAAVGTLSLLFLAKLGVDVLLAGVAAIRGFASSFFSESADTEDSVSLSVSDVSMSDTTLYGLFLLNLIVNLGWHGYVTSITTGGVSVYNTAWALVDGIAILITFVLWKHAVNKARIDARRAVKGNGPRLAA